MKTDLYTKVVLTVIAICLVILAAKDLQLVPKAYAAFDRGDEVVKVQLVSIDESNTLRWEALPVRVVQ